ncbi:MAG: excinuclease ABC subunit UvrC [Cytophagaceae bacterium]|nr:excinuclease ABC subunit UvrC [Cytophagaceae bacterium]MDW8457126.1 excinuclease ABC subunit UvrC [Cytophagaceae bacterium]
MREELKNVLTELPEAPGIYKYFNKNNELIYVGKAKDIKKRVTSYFNRTDALDVKTQKLVSLIHRIEYIIVQTEFDALLLENSLIKQFKPKYNIKLVDDKSYPYIVVTNERFPKLLKTRRPELHKGFCFGPYTSVKAMETMIDVIQKIFQLRTCSYVLSEKNIREKKIKMCLEYHIGNCKAPCEGLESESDYNEKIKQAQQLLRGNVNFARKYFKEAIEIAASKLEFEKAQEYKERLDLLEKFHKNNILVSPDIADLDVICIAGDDSHAAVHYSKVVNGVLLQSKTMSVKKKLEEPDEDILAHAIVNLRELYASAAPEVVTNLPIDLPGSTFEISTPQRGDKKKLVDMALKNCLYKIDAMRQAQERETGTLRVLRKLQQDLKLPDLPDHIECFDNSNLQGTNAVSAMVCFLNGKPAKKEYRHYNVKTVTGPNDFATMYEVITRRYKRLLEENKPLPKLIIVDGGKGQLNSACDALKQLGLYGRIPILGIAKNLEELFFPGDDIPIYLDKKSESLKIIQHMRDEAHRFGITHHRKKRTKSGLKTMLEDIPDVGQATIEKLLRKFKTISRIKKASYDELAETVGKNKADKILMYLSSTDKNS